MYNLFSSSIIPAGGENSELQLEVMHTLGTTTYIGVPDFLKIILEKADQKQISLIEQEEIEVIK